MEFKRKQEAIFFYKKKTLQIINNNKKFTKWRNVYGSNKIRSYERNANKLNETKPYHSINLKENLVQKRKFIWLLSV